MLPSPIEDPLQLLVEDRARAAHLKDPLQAFATLATSRSGQPAVRVVTVRSLSRAELLVSANATSPKVRSLRDDPRCELLIYWVTLQRQYRLCGVAHFVTARDRAELYRHSPWRAKAWDHVYEQTPQSTPTSRPELVGQFDDTLAALRSRYPDATEVPAPPNAGYLSIVPDRVEVQALDLEHRLHDRRLLHRTPQNTWTEQVLLP